MSKLSCKCGHIIVDQTDGLSYKAALLRDDEENAIADEAHGEIDRFVTALKLGDIEALMEKTYGKTASQIPAADYLVDRLTSVQTLHLSTAYECQVCGRLWLQKGKSGSFISYVPDNGGYQAILSTGTDKDA